MLKRIMSVLLIILLSFQFSGINVFAEEINNNEGLEENYIFNEDKEIVDKDGPIFNSISFNKHTIKVGEQLEILISVTDDISGVDIVEGGIIVGNRSEWVTFEETNEVGVFKYNINITNDMVYKNIKLLQLIVRDKSGNESYFSYELNGEVCVVVDNDGIYDNEAPILNDLTLNTNKIRVGEKLEIAFDVEDDFSQVYEIYMGYYVGNDYRAEYVYKDSNGQFKIEIYIDEGMIYKTLKVNYITVRDEAGNERNYDPEYLEDKYAYITDNNGEIDNKAPEVKNINLSNENPKVGEKVKVSMEAHDKFSGVASIQMEIIKDWSNEYVDMEYDEVSKKYIYYIDITEGMEYKNIKLNFILRDNAGNEVSYTASELGINIITVIPNDSVEIKENYAPIFNGIEISKNKINIGETTDIYVDAIDKDSGIEEVYLGIYPEKYSIQLTYDSNTGKYKGTLNGIDELKGGCYIIESVKIIDKVGNIKKKNFYKPYKINIYDDNGNINTDSIVIKDIGVDKKQTTVGEQVKISVDTYNKMATINKVVLSYIIAGRYEELELTYNYSIEKFEGVISIEDWMEYGQIRLWCIMVSDARGNVKQVTERELKPLTIDIVDSNGKVDTEAPKLISAQFDKKIAKPGETVKLSVEATDDLSGVSNIHISSNYYDYGNIELMFNPNSKKYEADIQIKKEQVYSMIEVSSIIIEDKVYNGKGYSKDNGFEELKVIISDSEGIIDNDEPRVKSYSLKKNNLENWEKPILNLTFEEDLSGINTVKVVCANEEREYEDSSFAYVNGKNAISMELNLSSFGDLAYDEKAFVKQIIVADYAGNINVYDYEKNDFSNLIIEVGQYVGNPNIDIDVETVYIDDEYLSGKASKPNVGIRVFLDSIEGETVSDDNGNFKIKIDPIKGGSKYTIEAYELTSGEILERKKVLINKSVDIIEDGKIDILDISIAANIYGKSVPRKGGPGMEIDYKIMESDINNDGIIDIYDLILISKKCNTFNYISKEKSS